jgi:hypothetical protein
LTFVGAVGSGPVEVGCVEVPLELPVIAALPLLEAALGATVTVMAEVTGIVSRFGPKENPTENEVVTVGATAATLGDAEDALLPPCHAMESRGSESGIVGLNIIL